MMIGKPSFLRPLEFYHFFIIGGLLILLWKISVDSMVWPQVPAYFQIQEGTDLSAGNATLGLEAIVVVAPNKSTGGETVWRQEGLLRAAEIAGIHAQILPQPNFTDEEVLNALTEDRRAEIINQRVNNLPEGDFTDAEGRLRLGHLHCLKEIVRSNYSTALILEDDADWDVAIRQQAPAIADAIRTLTYGSVGPWGFNWDLIALGHCGGGKVDDSKFLVIKDNTTGPAADFRTLWGPEKELKDHTRFVHGTHGAVCAFGYAVTRHGAQKLIDHLSGSGVPLDLDYASFCSSGLACYAVTPEIIHHQRWTGHRVTSSGKGHGALEPGENVQKFTINIEHSARCNSEPEVAKARAEGRQKNLIKCHPTGYAKDKFYERR